MADRPLDLLIIGASGQDGTFLGRLASERGIVWRGTSRTAQSGMETLDPCDERAVAALCDALAPRRIVLLAAQSSAGRSLHQPAATWQANVAPARAVCEWIRATDPSVRLVFAASGDCFGPRGKSSPAREDTPFAPKNPYAASKAAAAILVRSYRESFGLPLSIAFPFNHESALRGEGFVFGKVLAGLRRLRTAGGPPIALGDLSVVRDWGFAPDYAAAMLAMSELDKPEDLVLATGHSVSLSDAVRALVDRAGLQWADAIAAPDARFSHHSAGDEQHADPSRACAAIGWTGSTPFPGLADLLLSPGG